MSEDRPAPRRRGRRLRAFVALLLLAVFAGAWTGLYGVFEIAEGEVALVSRAGEFERRVDGPGRFVHWPFPVERRAVLSQSPQAIPERRVSMLTRDTQLITGVLRGRYRIADAEAARFGVLDARSVPRLRLGAARMCGWRVGLGAGIVDGAGRGRVVAGRRVVDQ